MLHSDAKQCGNKIGTRNEQCTLAIALHAYPSFTLGISYGNVRKAHRYSALKVPYLHGALSHCAQSDVMHGIPSKVSISARAADQVILIMRSDVQHHLGAVLASSRTDPSRR